MKQNHTLAYFLEDMWTKGFKLSDEDVRFVYFGRNSTNAPDWKVIIALKATLQFQHTFDGSFYMSILEHLSKEGIQSRKMAWQALEKKGLSKFFSPSQIQKNRKIR
ncbi:DUF6123 family protein [Thalassobacillus hwangdonensis]|uniref:DUF6123 family protein n=1 Tax=Thalassobacillus hwangdonensis TaxID=546108 RepID=A0ABW3KZT2_9BACI